MGKYNNATITASLVKLYTKKTNLLRNSVEKYVETLSIAEGDVFLHVEVFEDSIGNRKKQRDQEDKS